MVIIWPIYAQQHLIHKKGKTDKHKIALNFYLGL